MTQEDRVSPALLTDLYQVTMAYGYWKKGLLGHHAVFYAFFRLPPFNGGYTIACGLSDTIDYLQRFRFQPEDLEYLDERTGSDGKPLFEKEFLNYLRELRFTCDVDAVVEGEVVFPYEPLLRITGPLLQCQILETALLNILNFQTLVATKAARICLAAKDKPVMEFGLRRAHGPDGALAASRAAYVGGCNGTSNVLAGKMFGIPVFGTHAHSWVMAFPTELEAFQAYAETLPGNCVLLVDTYESTAGVRHAVEIGRWLRTQGKELSAIRLDSGDLTYLSIEARKILNEAGFASTKILASNDLDEHVISSLNEQGAMIDGWGVGTKLVTAYDQPALGGVYKMGAICPEDGKWRGRVKLSEQAAKISNPGAQQIRRFIRQNEYIADMIFDELHGPPKSRVLVDIADITIRRRISDSAAFRDLLAPIFRKGEMVYNRPSIHQSRDYARTELGLFYSGVKRLLNPHVYPVGLEIGLHEEKARLIEEARCAGAQKSHAAERGRDLPG